VLPGRVAKRIQETRVGGKWRLTEQPVPYSIEALFVQGKGAGRASQALLKTEALRPTVH
jgi:hypothetical protein